jgi:hypothetical protein
MMMTKKKKANTIKNKKKIGSSLRKREIQKCQTILSEGDLNEYEKFAIRKYLFSLRTKSNKKNRKKCHQELIREQKKQEKK